MTAIPGKERAIGGLGRWSAGALAWGFAEATLFFIVPDVLLSYATLRRGIRVGLFAGLAAVLGAMAGGTAMYLWGSRDPAGVEAALDRIPAISAAMIETVRSDMTRDWIAVLFAGAFGGVPYKIFAAEAAPADVGLGAFLAMSAPARYARFALAVLATALGRLALARIGLEHRAGAILAGFWLCFYAIYFAALPG